MAAQRRFSEALANVERDVDQIRPNALASDRDRLQAAIERRYRKSDWGCKIGGGFLNILLFGSVVLTSAATIISAAKLRLWDFEPTTISAVLTGIATIFTGFLTTGGVERKWRTNRRTRGELEKLKMCLDSSDANIEECRKRFMAIIDDHNDGITGSSRDSSRSH
jgi:hypothetical protein